MSNPLTFGSISLPSLSPKNSPPTSPSSPNGGGPGPRSVSWSLPSPSLPRTSVSVSFPPRFQQQESRMSEVTQDASDPNSPEFLAWRRLHLSQAKLSGVTEMAALMAGFSVVATVELQINNDANPMLLAAFTVTTALLVCTTMMAIMISTCILPHVQTVAEMSPLSKACQSPHDSMQFYIDLSWVLANSVSIFLFTLDVIILCWIKFTYFSLTASWSATAIMIPVLFGVCFFGIVFYRKIVKHQSLISDRKYEELEEMKRQLDISDSIMTV